MHDAAQRVPVLGEPTAYSCFHGLEVQCFGRKYCDPGSATDPAAREVMALRVRSIPGMHELFAPNPRCFNAKLVTAEAGSFPEHDTRHGITIHYGEHADGIIGLPEGTGFWIRSADCPTVVLTAGSHVAVMHAGLRSLIVQHWRPDCTDAADRGSVIDHALMRMPVARGEISARIFCGIGPDSYLLRTDHPVHSKHNGDLVDHVTKRWGDACVRDTGHGLQSLSLYHIIRAQLERGGVWGSRITWDSRDTAADKERGSYVWNSQRRQSSDTSEGRDRNNILVLNPKH